jgi:hypothetical protein
MRPVTQDARTTAITSSGGGIMASSHAFSAACGGYEVVGAQIIGVFCDEGV